MITVQNIYYMLSYAFSVLNKQGYKNIAAEQFNNTAELGGNFGKGDRCPD